MGLHQGSALSPCLFPMVMSRMMDEIRQKSPWFADDIMIGNEGNEIGRRKTGELEICLGEKKNASQ